MALVLNEEQVMLKESAAGFLAENATVTHLRALRDSNSERGFSDDVWNEMAQMGWAGIAIPGYCWSRQAVILAPAPCNPPFWWPQP
jgi:alkylation response protein AidB-like acyl-CoA dehydrogenase